MKFYFKRSIGKAHINFNHSILIKYMCYGFSIRQERRKSRIICSLGSKGGVSEFVVAEYKSLSDAELDLAELNFDAEEGEIS